MFCISCGKQIEDDCKFCPACGNRISKTLKKNEVIDYKDREKNLDKKLVIFILGILFVIVLLLFWQNNKITIDLNQYVQISVDGYDSLGVATADFNFEQFEEDYSDKIKFITKNGKEKTIRDSWGDYYDAVEVIMEGIYGRLDREKELSNGEIINFEWNCEDEYIESNFNCRLKYTDIMYEVTGLQEIGSFNPFDEIEIEIKGTNPIIYADFNNVTHNDMLNDIIYDLERVEGENRDVAVITAEVRNSEEKFVEKYGVLPNPNELRYDLSDMPQYVFSIDQIPSEEIETCLVDARKKMEAEQLDEDERIEEMEYLGTVVMSRPMIASTTAVDGNVVCFVFKIKIVCELETTTGYVEYPVEFYSYYKYTDVVKEPNGKFSCLYANIPFETISIDTGYHRAKSGSKYKFMYYGYESLDSLYDSVTSWYLEDYEIEDRINR